MRIFIGLLSVFCLILGFAGISSASVDSVYEAAVISVKGDVKADLKGDGNWVACAEGVKLIKGSKLKTGADASVQIVFDAQGLNVLKINPATEIVIDNSLVKMSQGSVLANFGNLKPGSTFTVKTPNAACGIRGSGMGVDFIGGMTVVAAYKDKVYVQGLDSAGNPIGIEVTIPEGWKSEVQSGGGITQPEGLTENEQEIWDAYVEAVQAGVGTEAEELAEGENPDNDTKNYEEDKEEATESETTISPSGSEDNGGNNFKY